MTAPPSAAQTPPAGAFPGRRCIATMTLPGTLRQKLTAARDAGFDAAELTFADLHSSGLAPREIRAVAGDLGLRIEVLQPLQDFEGTPEDAPGDGPGRARRALAAAAELGASTLLAGSSTRPDARDSTSLAAAQLAGLGDLAAACGIRVAYEALPWGTAVRTWERAWEIVQACGHPAVGLALDSFSTLASGGDARHLHRVPPAKIALVQLADAHLPEPGIDPGIDPGLKTWSLTRRTYPGHGDLDVAAFAAHVARTGYQGPVSLEIFHPAVTGPRADPAAVARQAMRSLRRLEASLPGSSAGRRP